MHHWLRGMDAPAPCQLRYNMHVDHVHCMREDEMAREGTGCPPISAKARDMKSLTLHTHNCLKSSSSSVE